MTRTGKTPHLAVVGGCGHAGLPLGLAFADRGLAVSAYDVNLEAVDYVNAGKMPFMEQGAVDLLPRLLANGSFRATADPASVRDAE